MADMFTTYEGVYAYAKAANLGLYQGCITAVASKPENKIYTPKGATTKIRQVDAGGAGTYSTTNGWTGAYGSGNGIDFIDYTAPNDRAKILRVDALQELASYQTGMTPSIELLAKDFMDNHLCSEVDATNIATWYSKVPSGNKFIKTTAGYEITSDKILQTLLNMEAKVFDSGWKGRTFCFLASDAYANLQAALIANYALAGVVKQETIPFTFPTGFKGDEFEGADSALSINIEVLKFNNLTILRMPSDRMYTLITLLDGVTAGQEAGGYVPNSLAVGFGAVKMFVAPEPAIFTDTRYLVANYLVPGEFYSEAAAQIELRAMNERMYGNVEVGYAGINQKANAFEYDIRIMYGGDVFDIMKKNCFSITDALVTV